MEYQFLSLISLLKLLSPSLNGVAANHLVLFSHLLFSLFRSKPRFAGKMFCSDVLSERQTPMLCIYRIIATSLTFALNLPKSPEFCAELLYCHFSECEDPMEWRIALRHRMEFYCCFPFNAPYRVQTDLDKVQCHLVQFTHCLSYFFLLFNFNSLTFF